MLAELDRSSGRITFSDQKQTGTVIEKALAWVSYRQRAGKLRRFCLTGLTGSGQEQSVEDVHGSGFERVVSCPLNKDGIELTYHIRRYDQQPFLLLRLSITNRGTESIYPHELCLYQANPSSGGRVSLLAGSSGLRFFKVGWHGWDFSGWRRSSDRDQLSWTEGLTRLSYSNPATPKPNRQGEFCSEGWAIIQGENAAIVTGLVSTAHQFGQVFASLRAGELSLQLICQADDVRLDPGESINSEWGYIQFLPLPNSSPENEYLEVVRRQMNARVPASPPPLMWTHWYQFYQDIDEQRFLHNLDSLTGLKEIIRYQVAELDDGYQSAWGDWLSTNPKFGHGLEGLGKEISSRGFSAGLWLAPFTIQRDSQLARKHPEWIVNDKNGKPARVGFLYNMFIYALDLTRPEVLQHMQQLAHTLAHDWGFAMLKIDFLNSAALPGKRYDPKMTRAEALRQGLEAIRQGAGEATFLLGCGCPFGPAIGVVDAMRIGPDTTPGWRPYFHWLRWATPLIKNNPSMPSLRNAMRHTMVLSSLNRKWWWNDPDCLLLRDTNTHLTQSEIQSMVSLVGLSGGMLVSSDDMRKVSAMRMGWLCLLIPNLGLDGVPQGSPVNGVPWLYQVKVRYPGGMYQLVALFNWQDKPADYHVEFDELGFLPGGRLHVFELWERKYQLVTEGGIVFKQVPAHGCKLVRIEAVGQSPQLIGDSLHISQGRELSTMRIVEDQLEIETIDLGRRVNGELWLSLDGAPKAARCNDVSVKVEQSVPGVYVIHVEFMGKAKIEIDL